MSSGVLRDDIDILYAASNKLTQAGTPVEQLEAISDYAREQGASSGILYYVYNDDDDGEAEWLEVVAEWVTETGVPLGLDTIFYMPSFAFHRVWMAYPDRPTLVHDTQRSDVVDERSRLNYARYAMRSVALLPLNIKGRWVGLVMFTWSEPYLFDERDQRIFTALIQQAAPVIDSVRLFEQTQKRAAQLEAATAELESAKDEIDILYAASNKLTRALTPDDLLAAASHYAREQGASSGALAYIVGSPAPEYSEIVAETVEPGGTAFGVGTRYHLGSASAFWMAQPDQPILIEHVADSPRLDMLTRMIYSAQGVESCAVLPLNNQGRWVGVITFFWHTPYRFSERDQRIYTALIQQTAPIIDSLRLSEQNRERAARAEQLLAVNTALSQASNEEEILAAFALFAAALAPSIITLSYIRMDATRQSAQVADMAMWRDGHILTFGENVATYDLDDVPAYAQWSIQPELPFLIEDVTTDGRLDALSRSMMSVRGCRALVVVPLHSGGRWQGILTVEWTDKHVFSAAEKLVYSELLPPISAVIASRQAYVAVERARHETELRARELETVAQLSAAAARILDVHELLMTVVELTRSSFDQYHIILYLLDATGEYLDLVLPIANTDTQRVRFRNLRVALKDERSMVASAARSRRSVIVNDIANAPEYLFTPMLTGAQSEMAMPMMVGEKLLGVLDVQAAEANRFREADVRVMGTLADLVAVALQNARLYEQAQTLAAVEERNRLARELHDSVSQALYGIALGARTARTLLERDPSRLGEPLDYVLSLAEAGLTEMRALIFELRPESLENEGLVTALNKQAASLHARHGIAVHMELCDEPRLPLEIKEAVYRIAREALHNTVKHARASQVTVTLACGRAGLSLDVRDNGVGFDTSGSFPGHLGLQSMRERTARLNGTLELHSAPGAGTHIRLVIPL